MLSVISPLMAAAPQEPPPEAITMRRGDGVLTLQKSHTRFAAAIPANNTPEELLGKLSSIAVAKNVSLVVPSTRHRMSVLALPSGESNIEAVTNSLRASHKSRVISHVYHPPSDDASLFIPVGTIFLRFKASSPMDGQRELLQRYALQIVSQSDERSYTVRVTPETPGNPLKVAKLLQDTATDVVDVAEPDLEFPLSFKYRPSDAHFVHQWHLSNAGNAPDLVLGADIGAEAAWNITRGSRDICICVMDDGFDLGHPDLTANGKLVSPWDFGQGDASPLPVFNNDNHGTSCAGVALAEENGVGTVGSAPRCSFMPIRTSGYLADTDIEAMFNYAATKGADVISCSWSASAWNFPLSVRASEAISKAATNGRRNNRGCVILFAAGNEDRALNDPTNGSVQGFAIHPLVCAVAASNSYNKPSAYSNNGKEIAFCAPSNGQSRGNKREIGRGIYTVDRRGSGGYSPLDYTDEFGGTSSATPLAAGVAALILSVRPDLTSAEVKRIMCNTAVQIGGVPQGQHSIYSGYGRVNAAQALATALSGKHGRNLALENRPNLSIRDLSTIEDTIAVSAEQALSDIEILIEIDHTYVGDLDVFITPPNHAPIPLIRAGQRGAQRNLNETFTPTRVPVLAVLRGASTRGAWKLSVVDTARQDTGVFKRWRLLLTF